MPLFTWIILFAATSLFWAWILFFGGADWLEGSFLSGFLISSFAGRWSAEGIKLFAALTWLGEGVWFLFGVFKPEARIWL